MSVSVDCVCCGNYSCVECVHGVALRLQHLNEIWSDVFILVLQILQGVQNWLDEPNNGDAAQWPAYELFK